MGLDIGTFATAISAREAQKVQAEISVKVLRISIDAEAASASALLAADNASGGVGQNVNTLG